MHLRASLKIAISLLLSVLIILASARLIFKIPKPLFLFAATVAVVVSIACWPARRVFRPDWKWLAACLVLSLFVISSLLIIIYRVDRAGWNWFQLTGYDTILEEHYPDWRDVPPAEFVARYPVFVWDQTNPDLVILRRGEYEFVQTVLVPRGLTLIIEPGTTLRFGVGCSLISYSPISARGTATDPILFTAKSNWFKWGAVGIVGPGKSIFEYVVFEHARRARVNGIDFYGGLSVIESEVEIVHCHFRHMFGKDAVNVRYGRTMMRHNLFEHAYKDGVDLDGGTGEISRNRFVDCRDEGIDLSENFDIQVFDNEIFDHKGGRMGVEVNRDAVLSMNTLGYWKGKN